MKKYKLVILMHIFIIKRIYYSIYLIKLKMNVCFHYTRFFISHLADMTEKSQMKTLE